MSIIYNLLSDFSTPAISDALDVYGINGGLEGLHPIFPGAKIVGFAYTLLYVEVKPGELAEAGDFIDNVPAGNVIVIANQGRTFCTVWGDILTFAAKQRGIAGTIIDGCCRDIERIQALNYPIFSKSSYMKSGKNRVKLAAKQVPIKIGETIIQPGDIIFADASGALAIPKNIANKIIKTAEKIQAMESNILADLADGARLQETRKKHKYNEFALAIVHSLQGEIGHE
jgi:regulator of RNase E activity RraA